MTMLKAVKYKPCLIFPVCQKKSAEFTDSTHTIYWPAKTEQKVASSWNSYLYICQYQIHSNINNACLSWHSQNVLHK